MFGVFSNRARTVKFATRVFLNAMVPLDYRNHHIDRHVRQETGKLGIRLPQIDLLGKSGVLGNTAESSFAP